MDLEKIMAQAQAMQKNMQEHMENEKAEKQNAEYKGESGAGLVSVVLNGAYGVKQIILDDELLKESKDIIEDLIAAALNNAVAKVEDSHQLDLSKMQEGFQMPEGFKFPFG